MGSLTHTGLDPAKRALAESRAASSTWLHRAGVHIVVAGSPLRRTLKLLRGLARGAWIVDEDWLVKADPAALEAHERRDEPGVGCRSSRIAGGGKALAGLHVTIRGATGMPNGDLEALLREAGAEVEVSRGAPTERRQSGGCGRLDAAPLSLAELRRRRQPLEVRRLCEAEPLSLADPEDTLLAGIMAGRFRHAAFRPNAPPAARRSPERRAGANSVARRSPERRVGANSAGANCAGGGCRAAGEENRAPRQQPPPAAPKPPPGDDDDDDDDDDEPSSQLTPRRAPEHPMPPPPPAFEPEDEEAMPPVPSKRARRSSTAAGDGLQLEAGEWSSLADGSSRLSYELLPLHGATASGACGRLALHEAVEVYRTRLPACATTHGIEPLHGGVKGSGLDFLGQLVSVSGARTATLRLAEGPTSRGSDLPPLLAACTFVAHAELGFCELQLLAVSRRHAKRGHGSALLGAVERHLRERGVRCVTCLAGSDAVGFWLKRGYTEDVALLPTWWSKLRDPFGNSVIMCKWLAPRARGDPKSSKPESPAGRGLCY